MRGKAPARTVLSLQHGITPAYAGKSLAGFHDTPYVWDHPRLCGEKLHALTDKKTNEGSPPPMRGKVVRAIPDILRKRITPAYAGKSSLTVAIYSHLLDHPRLCGEKQITPFSTPLYQGSPPPMRGKGYLEPFYSIYHRITPAYAGKRLQGYIIGLSTQDHPRLCGEKVCNFASGQQQVGSPPPMRGKVLPPVLIFAFQRITPAYAGKSSRFVKPRSSLRDHPRLCGEKHIASGRVCGLKRITPAYAGKSLLQLRRPQWIWDHPRLCGEKFDFWSTTTQAKGSPPPMRGKVTTMLQKSMTAGITPAYAGKSDVVHRSTRDI